MRKFVKDKEKEKDKEMKHSGRVRVKICGITRLPDALHATELGADALGFIFFRKSPRNILPAAAGKIIEKLPPFVDRVGVFVNSSVDDVVATAAVGLSCLQLHGNESPEFCTELRSRLPMCRVIKVFRVGQESRAEEFAPYAERVDGFLLDTYKKGEPGGTGAIFDWSVVERLGLRRPLLLAGGLGPGNICEAIDRVHPYGVDVNSGVESEPGIKDHQMLTELFGRIAASAIGKAMKTQ